jgi:sulfotransferase
VESKKFFYLAGLPRTGSTVLGEILNQNELLHVSPASPMCEIIGDVIARFRGDLSTLKAYQHPQQLPNLWRAMRNGFYEHREEPCIIDKSWVWHMDDPIDSTRKILNEEMKVICTVDDVADCLASFIMLIRGNPDYDSYIDRFLRDQRLPLTDENRCVALMDPGVPTSVGWAYQNLKKTWGGKNRANLLLIERADLVSRPEETLDRIYEFLDSAELNAWRDQTGHHFDRIEKEITEDDGVAYGIPNLHKLSPKLRGRQWQAKDVLGKQLFFKYKRMEFWRPKKRSF